MSQAAIPDSTTADAAGLSEAAQSAPGGRIARLSPEWQDWLTENLLRGCAEKDLLRIMGENGFEPIFAGHAIGVVRAMTERVRVQNGTIVPAYQCDAIRIPDQSRVRVHDREVQIGFILKNPNVALVERLLSPQECDQFITMSKGRMKGSLVVDRETGGSYESNVRRSEGCHFERGENALVRHVEQRMAELTGIPVDHGEPLQMLHYGVGGEYLPHHDYFEPSDPGSARLTQVGGQRVATMVVYLNDVPEGGETAFPEVELAVKAHKGSAVYFEYHNAAGLLDTRCLHAGRPVVRGDKWIMTKWLRERPYVS